MCPFMPLYGCVCVYIILSIGSRSENKTPGVAVSVGNPGIEPGGVHLITGHWWVCMPSRHTDRQCENHTVRHDGLVKKKIGMCVCENAGGCKRIAIL